MIAVIFEVEPHVARRQDYLDAAARLKTALETVDGFISVERFQSISNPGKLVSLSFWEDESAVACWRSHPDHRGSQTAGRDGIFAGYRLRVASVIRDYGMSDRAQAPADLRARHG